MRIADASLWALTTLVVAVVALFDAVRTRSYADASFVLTASLLYFNAVWIGTRYTSRMDPWGHADVARQVPWDWPHGRRRWHPKLKIASGSFHINWTDILGKI